MCYFAQGSKLISSKMPACLPARPAVCSLCLSAQLPESMMQVEVVC